MNGFPVCHAAEKDDFLSEFLSCDHDGIWRIVMLGS